MMNWYEWETEEQFHEWHSALCTELDYPIISINQATGEPDLDAAMTTAYTTSLEIEGKIIATVEDKYAEGLTPTELRPPLKVFGDEA